MLGTMQGLLNLCKHHGYITATVFIVSFWHSYLQMTVSPLSYYTRELALISQHGGSYLETLWNPTVAILKATQENLLFHNYSMFFLKTRTSYFEWKPYSSVLIVETMRLLN